jgi:regulatory protein
MAFAKPSLKGRALRLLSQREHSRLELERKLKAFEEEPGALMLALDELQAKGFISESRVLESVIHRRAAKLGLSRIRQELQNKGIAPDLIDTAMLALSSSELERAHEVWRKKFDALPDSPAAHARQVRFLMSRGFSAEVVRKVLSSSGRDAPDFQEE